MPSDIPKSDSETNKGPMIAIFVIIVLFILGYFAYILFVHSQTD